MHTRTVILIEDHTGSGPVDHFYREALEMENDSVVLTVPELVATIQATTGPIDFWVYPDQVELAMAIQQQIGINLALTEVEIEPEEGVRVILITLLDVVGEGETPPEVLRLEILTETIAVGPYGRSPEEMFVQGMMDAANAQPGSTGLLLDDGHRKLIVPLSPQ